MVRHVLLGTCNIIELWGKSHTNYTAVDPKQWVDSRSVLGNKVKDMK